MAEFKNRYQSLNKYVVFIGVSSSTHKGWTDSHQKDVLTSVSVALTAADRIEKFNLHSINRIILSTL